jgi:flagella basal body P-ring formation protein FlgA
MKILLFTLLLLPLLLSATPCAAAEGNLLIDRKEMEQVLVDYLSAQSELLPQVELHLVSAVFPEPFSVPQGRIEHQLIPARPGVIGSRRMTLLTRVDGQIINNQSIRVELEAMAEIAVAAATLRRGTLLGEEHLEMRYQDISRLSEPIFSVAEAVGKIVKRSLRLGEPIQARQVESPPLIKRGERVVIELRGTGLSLSAVGEAREDGRAGESIKVINSSSSREIISQVVAPGLVRVEL